MSDDVDEELDLDEIEEDWNEPFAEDDEDVDTYVDDGPHCVGCGCSYTRPCEGGCVWATPDRCSRCA